MNSRNLRSGRVLGALVASACGLAALTPTASTGASVPSDAQQCAPTSAAGIAEPAPLADAIDAGLGATLIGDRSDLPTREVKELVSDEAMWVDACARLFVVDEALPAHRRGAASEAPAQATAADVFNLSSRPNSTRTLYLDFTGATYSGTWWRNGETIVSPAYSRDADPTTFNDDERAQIELAWASVAEEFAPFDVNVTTREPDPSALTRSGPADPTYGMAAVITPTNSVGDGCGCGGVAYVGVIGNPSANQAQPAWIFTNGSGTGGYNVGQVVAHELGHSFGLGHDGDNQVGYYRGANGWAPLMGASYGSRASHWSRGEYLNANNTEDDLTKIAGTAPLVADDHANGVAGATKIAAGSTTPGLITSGTDTDAFTFAAAGPTTLTVTGPAGISNLDAKLQILDASGAVVATVDPVADVASDASMNAQWSAQLPSTHATYTAIVDGTGNGDPKVAGRYSDYGSLGQYTVALNTLPVPVVPPTLARISFASAKVPPARVKRRYKAVIRFAGPVATASVSSELAPSLKATMRKGRVVLTGIPRKRGVERLEVTLVGEQETVKRKYRLRVR